VLVRECASVKGKKGEREEEMKIRGSLLVFFLILTRRGWLAACTVSSCIRECNFLSS
jgi:hypothetical protein